MSAVVRAAVPSSLLARLRAVTERPEERLSLAAVLGSEIDDALAGGLLRGAVVEISAPHGRARTTAFALSACLAAQHDARRFGSHALCAWIDPSRSLFGPGLAACGLDLARFFVVVPELELFARAAVRVVESRAFSVVVIDARSLASLERWPTTVRRLALAVEGTACSVLLVTDLSARRSVPLPTASRIELSCTRADALTLRVAKDRHGRIASDRTLPWRRSA